MPIFDNRLAGQYRTVAKSAVTEWHQRTRLSPLTQKPHGFGRLAVLHASCAAVRNGNLLDHRIGDDNKIGSVQSGL